MKRPLLPMALLGLTLSALASLSYANDRQQYTRTLTANAVGFLDPRPVFVEVPTMGVVELVACFNAPSHSMWVRLLSFENAQPFFGVGTVTGSDLPAGVNPVGVISDQSAGMFQSGGGTVLIANLNGAASALGAAGHWEWSLWRADGDDVAGAHVSIDGWNDPSSGKCRFSATVD
jgi:hypothetical protein